MIGFSGMLGRSQGCFAVADSSLPEIMTRAWARPPDLRGQSLGAPYLNITAILNRLRSNKMDCDVDVSACCLRVRAYLVGLVHDRLCAFPLYTRQANVEAGTEEVGTVRQIQVQVHLSIDGRVSGESDFPFASHNLHRTFEAGRPPRGEQLLRIGASAWCTRYREFDVQPAVRAVGRAAPTAPRCVGLGRVHQFFALRGRECLCKLSHSPSFWICPIAKYDLIYILALLLGPPPSFPERVFIPNRSGVSAGIRAG